MIKRFLAGLLVAALSLGALAATIQVQGPRIPAAGGGVAPTVVQSDVTKWDGVDSGNGIFGTAVTSWSAQVGDVLVGIIARRNNNNTDSLAGLAVDKFDGTAAVAGGFTVDQNFVFHDGVDSTMCAIASGVVTTAGTIQLNSSGFTIGAGSTNRNSAILLLRGVNTSGSRVNAINAASHSTTSATTGTVATGGAGIIVAVMATQEDQASITEGGGLSLVVEDGNVSLVYRTVSSNTTDQGAWTLATGSNGAGCAVAYKSSTP